jgi:hypothetical protein
VVPYRIEAYSLVVPYRIEAYSLVVPYRIEAYSLVVPYMIEAYSLVVPYKSPQEISLHCNHRQRFVIPATPVKLPAI